MTTHEVLLGPSRQSHSGTLRPRLFGVLLGWMGFSFILGALTKFYRTDTSFGSAYPVKFAAWGYPAWYRFFGGAGEFLAASMLLTPRLRVLGAGIMVLLTSGAVATHIGSQDPVSHKVAALVYVTLALIIAYVTRPNDWPDVLAGRPPHRDRQSTGS